MSKDTDLNGFTAWLATAGKHTLLTAAEERRLAKRIERGDLAAKEKLVRHNVKLVVSIAKKYQGQGVEREDLLQEGMFGLIRAAERYDYRKGFRFSTFATFWVKQSVRRGIGDRGRAIRLPVHQGEALQQLRKADEKLFARLGRAPTTAEIAGEVGKTTAEVDELRLAARRPASLDKPVSEEEGADALGSLIEDRSGCIPGPADAALLRCRNETVSAALADLSYRQRRVIVGRYGLEDDQPQTLDQLATLFDVTRERVRQIEIGAVQELREGSHTGTLYAELQS